MSTVDQEPVLMHNTMRIYTGHLKEFKQAIDRSVELVEQHGPQLMVQVFIDESALIAHSFQLYPDSAAVELHWQISDPYIRDVMNHCEVDRLAMYGEPSSTVSAGIERSAGGATKTVVNRYCGFLRLPAPTTRHDTNGHGSAT